MSLSMSDMVRFQALELRVAELEKHMSELCVAELERHMSELCCGEKRRGRPPKNLEERMKAQEHDPIDAE